ncbi:NADH-quinone oxidoreductase subunit M [Glycomyces tritici]|uniref:NADH-quinone oxidoreductase subunit M n=1 Tax=Glycomyces tritici TaxID=2665176 RepID=A0ABT7YQY4_9ACTN|nr:NADH-quinone oxidoreductase subunit M [Glycomyces tritici]MDN3241059.1 NADH-quinone oxidoreductase subunit M [Glycomyces tritici]
MNELPLLSALVAVPLIGALVVASIRRENADAARWTALAAAGLVAVIAALVAVGFDYSEGAPWLQFTESYTWVEAWDLNLSWGVDGIALLMLLLTVGLTPIAMLAAWRDLDAVKRSVPAFFALILALEAAMIATFLASNVLLFYFFFEAMLVPMYFLIGSYGTGPKKQYAAVKFFLYSLLGGLLMLVAVIALWVHNGGVFDWQTLVDAEPMASGALQNWLFLGFFIAFAIKAPFFPFHTWLPDAGGAAPAAVAALLVGVMDKIGTFAILRYCLPLFPEATQTFAPWIIGMSVIGVVYAAFVAIGQTDLKRLVAYTSIAHFGFIGLGIFAFTQASATGAVLYMFNHGLATGLLFIVVGFLAIRRGSAQIADYGGAAKTLPVLAGIFLFAGLASLSLPGTAPFISEFLVLFGAFTGNEPVAVVATLGIILAAAYVIWMYQRTMQGERNPVLDEMPAMKRDLTMREKALVAPLVIAILGFGFFPQPLIDAVEPAVDNTLLFISGSPEDLPAAEGVTNE